MRDKDTEKLIAEVEALCATVMDEEKGEQWGETLKRIDRLNKLVKKIRKAAL
jgi:hypothetical protein